MTEVSNHRLRYKDQDVEFELEGEREFVEGQAKAFYEWIAQLQPQLMVQGRRVGLGRPRVVRPDGTVVETRIAPLPITPEHSKALQEFLRKVKPTGGPDVALAAGYFLTKELNQPEFITRDLTRVLEPIKSISVGNMSLAVRRAVERGLLIEHRRPEGGRSTYSVSELGIERVENGFV